MWRRSEDERAADFGGPRLPLGVLPSPFETVFKVLRSHFRIFQVLWGGRMPGACPQAAKRRITVTLAKKRIQHANSERQRASFLIR